MSEQPLALRLADVLGKRWLLIRRGTDNRCDEFDAAIELRRQHREIEQLKAERDAALKLARDYAREAYLEMLSWGAIASDHFRLKWNLEGNLQKWLERGAPNAPREVVQIDAARSEE